VVTFSSRQSPLRSTLEHIDNLESRIDYTLKHLNDVPYPYVLTALSTAGKNYQNGLNALRNSIEEYLIKRATAIAKLSNKQNDTTVINDIIKKHWSPQLNLSYRIAESYTNSFLAERNAKIPEELYFLVADIFKEFKEYPSEEIFVFREGTEFKTESFEATIWEPLDPLLQVGQQTILEGTVNTFIFRNIKKEFVLNRGYVITYIAGEATNPSLWPIFVHEAFHLLDNRLGLFDEFEKKLLLEKRELPALEKNPDINRAWLREIFQDIAAVHYFGPLYAFSIMVYFDTLPYYQTIQFPAMSARLYAVSRYLDRIKSGQVKSPYTDYLERAVRFCGPLLDKEITEHPLEIDMKNELDAFYEHVTSWIISRGIKLFVQRITDYTTEASKASELLKIGEKDGGGVESPETLSARVFRVPYVDRLFTFDEVVDLVFTRNVSLAIDPIILLNIALSVSEEHRPTKVYDKLTDCMKKWYVKRAWDIVANKYLQDGTF
jgi:hypothetical protein